MIIDIVEVQPLENYHLRIRFDNGVEGVINMADFVPFDGMFAPFKDDSFFRQVRVNKEIGTIVWPNDADLDPGVLYSEITGEPIVIDGYGVVYEPNKQL